MMNYCSQSCFAN